MGTSFRTWSVLLSWTTMLLFLSCSSGPAEKVEDTGSKDTEAIQVVEEQRYEAHEAVTSRLKNSPPMAEELTLRFRTCVGDSDCVWESNGCCDCANGGRDIAMNRDMVSEFREQFNCSGECTKRADRHGCRRGKVYCKDSICVSEVLFEFTVPVENLK
jgi:hypothetical protein